MKVGDTVRHSEHPSRRGVIRFIGPLDGHRGVFYGVEWEDEDPTRSDGEVDGKRYFQCPKGCGSFVQVKKLVKIKSLAASIAERYDGDQTAGSLFLVQRTSINTKLKVEFVTKENSVGSRVTAVCLSDDICGFPGDLPNITLDSLDISRTLFCSLREVLHCARCFQVKELRATSLTFHDVDFHSEEEAIDSFSSMVEGLRVETLILSKTNLSLPSGVILGLSIPSVTMLSLDGLKEGGKLSLQNTKHKLKHELPFTLSVQGNNIQSWEEAMDIVEQLVPFGLNSINLTDNSLGEADESLSASFGPFDSFHELGIANTGVSSNALKPLARIFRHLSGLTVWDGGSTAKGVPSRLTCIVLFPSLIHLNKSRIMPKERRDSEITYAANANFTWREELKPLSHPSLEEMNKIATAISNEFPNVETDKVALSYQAALTNNPSAPEILENERLMAVDQSDLRFITVMLSASGEMMNSMYLRPATTVAKLKSLIGLRTRRDIDVGFVRDKSTYSMTSEIGSLGENGVLQCFVYDAE